MELLLVPLPSCQSLLPLPFNVFFSAIFQLFEVPVVIFGHVLANHLFSWVSVDHEAPLPPLLPALPILLPVPKHFDVVEAPNPSMPLDLSLIGV